jgi:hypothetical protein
VADEAVLNKVLKKFKNMPPLKFKKGNRGDVFYYSILYNFYTVQDDEFKG